MSGFAGIICADGATPDLKFLQRMADALAFRGPHAKQVFSRPGAGFCFTLLQTGPSPQAEQQPCTLHGKLWLLGDVRLDAREDLLSRLGPAMNKPLPAITDEEFLLEAWRHAGPACLERLTGDFSFVLWDEPAQQICCARDLIGSRPFFYAHAAGRLFFSNTLNVLRLVPEISADLDPHFIGDFLLQSWCPDPHRSAFSDIRRLPPGHLLTYSDGRVQIRRFGRLPIEEPLLLKRPSDYVEQFRFHLEQAVRDRLPLGPAAVFMSGGLDSTSVAATAKKLQLARSVADSPQAFTVDYSPLFDDQEGQLAAQVAAHLGVPHSVLNGSAAVPFADWHSLSIKTPEPCAEPFFALHVQHYRQVAAYSRVVLAGDGGDDVLTGRAWPYLTYLLRRARLPTAVAVFGGYLLRHGTLPPLRAGIRSRLRRWFGFRDQAVSCPSWLNPDFVREFHLPDRWRELQQPPKFEHPLHPAGYASLTGGFWSSVYETEDAGWTGVPVEARPPLLDQRLIRFLLRLPPIPWCMHKHLLRTAMAGLLPDSVLLRRKTPLAGDPLLLHAEKNGWQPVLPNNPCPRLAKFVDLKSFTATSHPARCLSLWDEIRPIALDLWLKSVENQLRIL
jgi:asparagine synthase (glutamine-hydrolysing)